MPSTTIISTAACSDGFRAGSRSAAALPAALLHLAHIPGLGAVRLNRLLQAFGSAEAVLEAGTSGLTGIVPARLAEAIVQTDTRREQEAVAAWLARGEGRDLLTLADARGRFARHLRLSLNGQASGANAQGAALRLQSILAPYIPGNCPVRLTYRNKEAVCELNLGDASRVRLEDDLLLSLSDWLSSENVSIEYN